MQESKRRILQQKKKKCKELEDLDVRRSPNIYKKIKEFKVRKARTNLGIPEKNGQLFNENEQISKRWEEYIRELYDDDRTEKGECYQNIKKLKNYITEKVLPETIKNP